MNKKIRIYFTSDLHGHFFPASYADTAERDMGLFKCANRFEKDGNTLIIDGGDILQGSAFVNYCHGQCGSSRPVAEIMNGCKYDFVTLGNHDFNYGAAYLDSYLNALNACCVCQNYRTQAGEAPYPFQIRTLQNGLRLGISGIVTDHVMVWERPGNMQNVRIDDPFAAAKAALAQMRGQCDLTLCIYHGGFERSLETGAVLTASTENIAWRICEELDYDILLTGHQHIAPPVAQNPIIVIAVENLNRPIHQAGRVAELIEPQVNQVGISPRDPDKLFRLRPIQLYPVVEVAALHELLPLQNHRQPRNRQSHG